MQCLVDAGLLDSLNLEPDQAWSVVRAFTRQLQRPFVQWVHLTALCNRLARTKPRHAPARVASAAEPPPHHTSAAPPGSSEWCAGGPKLGAGASVLDPRASHAAAVSPPPRERVEDGAETVGGVTRPTKEVEALRDPLTEPWDAARAGDSKPVQAWSPATTARDVHRAIGAHQPAAPSPPHTNRAPGVPGYVSEVRACARKYT